MSVHPLSAPSDDTMTAIEMSAAAHDRVVAQSKIRRPTEKDYRGGYDAEGYAIEEAKPTA